MDLNKITNVRYIKLGEGGRDEHACKSNGEIRFGFNTGQEAKFSYCLKGNWPALKKSYLADGRAPSSASNIVRQAQFFFEADESTLWITFMFGDLWWAVLSSEPPESRDDASIRKVVQRWHNHDLKGNRLQEESLPGHVTSVIGFRGTSCNFSSKDYLIARLQGKQTPLVAQAEQQTIALHATVQKMIKELSWEDFEVLADLIFAASGWQRISILGKAKQFKDLEMLLPTTDEKAVVQVKSQATLSVLKKYEDLFAQRDQASAMFFVYHSSPDDRPLKSSFNFDDGRKVHVWGPDQLAWRVIRCGLVDWLLQKCPK